MRCAVLWLVIIAALAAVGFYLSQHSGDLGWQAAAIAAGVCGLGSTLALVLTALCRGPNGALYSLLFGMLFRMGLPLGVGVWLTKTSPDLADAGVFGAILVTYLVTLAVETVLVLPLVRTGRMSKGAAHG
jgi:hypothetical protein